MANKLKWGKPSQFQKAPAGTALDASEYVKTKDAVPETGKTYYTEASGVYTAATIPGTTFDTGTDYYELVSVWKDLPMPKEGTLQLSQQDGQETTAVEEGGDIVDVRYGKNTFQVEWDEFDLDKDYCFEDNEGMVPDETALRWLPENDEKTGFYIPRAKVRVSTSFNVADGAMRKNTLKVMKPEDGGNSVRPYVKSQGQFVVGA